MPEKSDGLITLDRKLLFVTRTLG